jgi:hypothetical protein
MWPGTSEVVVNCPKPEDIVHIGMELDGGAFNWSNPRPEQGRRMGSCSLLLKLTNMAWSETAIEHGAVIAGQT